MPPKVRKVSSSSESCINEISKMSTEMFDFLHSDEFRNIIKNCCKSEIEVVSNELNECKKLIKMQSECINTLLTEIKNINIINSVSSTYYRDAAISNKAKHFEPIITVIPKDQTQKSDLTKSEIKSKIKPDEIAVGISKIKEKQNGTIIIGCDSHESCNKLVTLAKNELGDKYLIVKPKSKNPRLIITGVDENEISDNDSIFRKKLIDQNQLNDIHCDDLKVVYKKKTHRGYTNVVIECTPHLCKQLLLREKLNIGWRRCRIEEHVYIR